MRRERSFGAGCDYFPSETVLPSPADDALTLADPLALALSARMSDDKPLSLLTLTPARITLLVLGVLALVMIAGAILGGVGNYQTLRAAASSSLPPPAASAQ
jgi:hypothetical protein